MIKLYSSDCDLPQNRGPFCCFENALPHRRVDRNMERVHFGGFCPLSGQNRRITLRENLREFSRKLAPKWGRRTPYFRDFSQFEDKKGHFLKRAISSCRIFDKKRAKKGAKWSFLANLAKKIASDPFLASFRYFYSEKRVIFWTPFLH